MLKEFPGFLSLFDDNQSEAGFCREGSATDKEANRGWQDGKPLPSSRLIENRQGYARSISSIG